MYKCKILHRITQHSIVWARLYRRTRLLRCFTILASENVLFGVTMSHHCCALLGKNL